MMFAMFTTRFRSSAAVLLCALLLQNCQSHALRATEEELTASLLPSASAVRQRISIELSTIRSLTSPSASLADHVSASSHSTVLANEEVSLTPATMGNSSTGPAPYDLPAVAMPGASYTVPLDQRCAAIQARYVGRANIKRVLQVATGVGVLAYLIDHTLFERTKTIIPSMAFGPQEWKKYYGEVGAAPSLPTNIETILGASCPFWPEKQVKDTHLLALIPATVDGAPFTLNLLGELIRRPKSDGHRTQYRGYGDDNYERDTKEQIGAIFPAVSYWLLMTRDMLPDSHDKAYAYQKELVAAYAKRAGLPYELPKALEAATVILTHYVRTGERLYDYPTSTYDALLTFTRCQDLLRSYGDDYDAAIVGGFFESSGLTIGHGYDYGGGSSDDESCGVSGVRKVF
jgi:hypothetical protein